MSMFLPFKCFITGKYMTAFRYHLVIFALQVLSFHLYSLGPTEKLEMKHCSSLSLENGGELCEKFNVTGDNSNILTCR